MDKLFSIDDNDIFSLNRKVEIQQWSISWSDLMMTMLILFVMLYVYEILHLELLFNSDKYKADKQSDLDNFYYSIHPNDTSEKTFTTNDLDKFISANLSRNETFRIILSGDLLFDSGKANLKSQALDSLMQISQKIKQTSHIINIEGHTDDIPIRSGKFPSNLELSAIRACVVARFLIEKIKIPAKRFYISGYAHLKPIKPNSNDINRAHNRRVEIILTKKNLL